MSRGRRVKFIFESSASVNEPNPSVPSRRSSSLSCNRGRPSVCPETVVQQSRSVSLYIPPTYKRRLRPWGPVRIHLLPRALDNRPSNDDRYRSRIGGKPFIRADAHRENCDDEAIPTLVPGSQIDRSINISLSGHGRAIQQSQLGFDFDFRPICVVLPSPSTSNDEASDLLSQLTDSSRLYDHGPRARGIRQIPPERYQAGQHLRSW